MAQATNDLLIIWHSRTGASRDMAKAAYAGAFSGGGTGAGSSGNAVLMEADAVTPDDLLGASAFLFVCPENLATMSGAMKEMFDRTYYSVLGKIEGRPFATIIAAGSDGEGAQRQIDRIAKGWRLKRVADPMIVQFDAQSPEAILALKTVPGAALGQCRELGAALAAGIRLGVF